MPEIHYRLTLPPITVHSSARDIVDLVLLHMCPKHVAACLIRLDDEQMDGHEVSVLLPFEWRTMIESNCAGKTVKIKEIVWRLPDGRPSPRASRQNSAVAAYS